MATIERYPRGHQFFDNATPAVPLAGGKLLYFEAGTTDAVATYADAAGLVPNTVDGGGAIVLNAQGRLEEAVYLSSAQDYKELLTDADDVTLDPWPEDDIPAAPVDPVATTAAAPLLPWINKSASEVLDAEDFIGKALFVDDSAASRTMTLPSAVEAGNGYAGIIAKASDAANTVTIDTQGGQTINGASSYVLTAQFQAVVIIPDGANWKIAAEFRSAGSITADDFADDLISALTALTALDRTADFILIWDADANAFKKCSPKFFDSREPDSLHSLSVADKDLTSPPGSPSEGDRYIVGSAASGSWTAQDGKVASFFNGAWAFYAPAEGWFAWVADEDLLYRYTGSVWVAEATNHTSLGIATANGARLQIKSLSEEVTLSGATTDSTIAFPNPSLSLGASIRVTELITASGGGSSFTVGDANTANRYGTIGSFAVGTTNPGVIGPTGYYGTDDEIRFTVNAGAFTGGKVRVTIWYMELTPPTS